MKSILRIFIRDNCSGCQEAQQIAVWIKQDYPQLTVELVDIANPQARVPEAVFATPTYMLDNQIVSLGNPSLAEVAAWLASVTFPLL